MLNWSMNRYTIIFILFLIFAFPVFSTGEGTIEVPVSGTGYLPVSRVILYTAGLAQMVHETTVNNDEIVSFPVDPKDINDILKSLMVEDLDGGTVDVVNFDSNDPLSVSLGDLRINPSGSPVLSDFLKRTQGESVTVSTDKGVFQGRIFSVEKIQKVNQIFTTLNLIDSTGIQAVDITELKTLQFDDPGLQEEMIDALGMIARSRVKSVRILKISFKGSGERRIRLSYIRAVPLWKTSYRLVIDKNGISRLEGWALVQNTGSQSWENIQLGFVAGQPNAFTMDLATPRYITRQQVDIASAAPLGPTSYAKAYAPEPSPARSLAYSEAPSMVMDEDMYGYEKKEPYSPAPVVSQASGIREGNFYRYDVKLPVTIDARSSGMIPIIIQEHAGESLGIYDPSYNKVFKGIRLINSTDAHWAAGPVTVSEGRYYGGDALIPDMIPESERLLSYAVHGTLEVQKTRSVEPQRITSLKVTDGILYRTDKILRETRYQIDGDEDELILIHPKESGWKLTNSPEVSRESPGEYRFSLQTWEEPITVAEEYIISNQFNLNGFRSSDLVVYMDWKEISPLLKSAMAKIAELKQNTDNIRAEINALTNRISRIERDQNRMRENMKVLDKESDLFNQYAAQLSDQETELEDINTQIGNKQTRLQAADRALKEYIISIDL
jgi:hypothetical protein